ncbi:MAG: hypothetical protein SVM79_00555 [Chloroflexota bacterium]|nr:hypothetical protein [Chloroflexota bacterium]
MIRIWGILSGEEENAGFDLVLDEVWYIMLMHKDMLVARFNPRDYTQPGLQKEVKKQIREFLSKHAV